MPSALVESLSPGGPGWTSLQQEQAPGLRRAGMLERHKAVTRHLRQAAPTVLKSTALSTHQGEYPGYPHVRPEYMYMYTPGVHVHVHVHASAVPFPGCRPRARGAAPGVTPSISWRSVFFTNSGNWFHSTRRSTAELPNALLYGAAALWGRALSNSAVDRRVLWNQLPEFVKRLLAGAAQASTCPSEPAVARFFAQAASIRISSISMSGTQV